MEPQELVPTTHVTTQELLWQLLISLPAFILLFAICGAIGLYYSPQSTWNIKKAEADKAEAEKPVVRKRKRPKV